MNRRYRIANKENTVKKYTVQDLLDISPKSTIHFDKNRYRDVFIDFVKSSNKFLHKNENEFQMVLQTKSGSYDMEKAIADGTKGDTIQLPLDKQKELRVDLIAKNGVIKCYKIVSFKKSFIVVFATRFVLKKHQWKDFIKINNQFQIINDSIFKAKKSNSQNDIIQLDDQITKFEMFCKNNCLKYCGKNFNDTSLRKEDVEKLYDIYEKANNYNKTYSNHTTKNNYHKKQKTKKKNSPYKRTQNNWNKYDEYDDQRYGSKYINIMKQLYQMLMK